MADYFFFLFFLFEIISSSNFKLDSEKISKLLISTKNKIITDRYSLISIYD